MTVIFFCPNILRNAHRYIFQLDRLKEEGYKIVLLDATKFYGNTSTVTEDIILNNRVECVSMIDFSQFKESLPKEPVLYVAFDQYMQFAAPVLNILVRKQDKLLTYHTKRFSTAQFPTNIMRIMFDRVVRQVDKILPLHFFGFFYRWRYKLFIPDYYLCSTNYLIPTKAFLTIKKDHRIVVHSDDINNVIYNDKPPVLEEGKKTGVFLDQVLPFQDRLHPKLVRQPLPEGYIETYYRNLENTLIELKEQLQLDEVVVALHPDALKLKKELSDKFQGFKTYLGVTNELIRDATVVFGHSSTALGYAIFYKKPVVLLQDDVILSEYQIIKDFMAFFKDNLGFQFTNMGKPCKLRTDSLKIDEKRYSAYTRKFLKDNDIKENSYYYAISRIKSDVRSQ